MERAVLIATRSPGKLAELRELFARAGLSVEDLTQAGIAESGEEDAIEAFETFEENALAKARYFHARSGGKATVADDSGLEVMTLGGAPGVRSKRWSGRTDLSGRALDVANNEILVAAMASATDRRARYVCAAAYVDDEHELVCRGVVEGTILPSPLGSGGFGYDPYFLSSELGRTFAGLTMEEKEAVSHRGRAFGALLRALVGGG